MDAVCKTSTDRSERTEFLEIEQYNIENIDKFRPSAADGFQAGLM